MQKGSNITPERLRFDFNFGRKLTEEEIKKANLFLKFKKKYTDNNKKNIADVSKNPTRLNVKKVLFNPSNKDAIIAGLKPNCFFAIK